MISILSPPYLIDLSGYLTTTNLSATHIDAEAIAFCLWITLMELPVASNESNSLIVPLDTKPPRIKDKPLEALYRHLQGTSYHDFLLKIWVIKDNFLDFRLP
jgi:hypothetical protein